MTSARDGAGQLASTLQSYGQNEYIAELFCNSETHGYPGEGRPLLTVGLLRPFTPSPAPPPRLSLCHTAAGSINFWCAIPRTCFGASSHEGEQHKIARKQARQQQRLDDQDVIKNQSTNA